MDSLNKLAGMGCGKAILNSCIDRSAISAAISNATTFLKYYKYAVKSGIYRKKDAINGIMPYYNELMAVEHLANIYHALWLEKFSKTKLNVENFINSKNSKQ